MSDLGLFDPFLALEFEGCGYLRGELCVGFVGKGLVWGGRGEEIVEVQVEEGAGTSCCGWNRFCRGVLEGGFKRYQEVVVWVLGLWWWTDGCFKGIL